MINVTLKHRFKKAVAVLLLLLLLLLLLGYPSTALLGQNEKTLLQEIESYIKSYYIYKPDEKYFPLQSLEELPKVFQDPYSTYLDREGMKIFKEGLERFLPGGIGISLEQKGSQFFVIAVFPGTPADRAGIKSGDMIVSVNGSPVFNLSLEEVVTRVRGEKGTGVRLCVRRNEQILAFEMTREKISLPLVEYTWADEGIALLKIYSFGDGLVKETVRLLEELKAKGLRGLILDLRNNQGGYVEEALAMCSLFTDGVLLKIREKDSSWQEVRGPEMGETLSIPAVVLVNGWTASAGEIMASALKENRAALLVGETTFGKGTMQTLFDLGEEGCLKLTTAEFTSPQGRTIEGRGIEPQYLVPLAGDQLPLALKLLHCRLKAGKEDALFKPVRINGRAYYPLRAVLLQTGRGIAAGDSPGVYLFYWDNILYRLDLRKSLLSWEDHTGEARNMKVLYHQGITYVQGGFLAEALGLPIN